MKKQKAVALQNRKTAALKSTLKAKPNSIVHTH
jgi:hypothetical protein